MKALVLTQLNKPLEFKEVTTPEISENEALIKLEFASINHRDVWITKGQYANVKTPIILGSDGYGEVCKVGSEIHNHWLGKKVIINPSIDWGENERVQQKKYTILGLPENGTFAEYVKVAINNLFTPPTHLRPEEAAALPLAGLTAFRALFTRAELKQGEKVLITGIGGGVALFALQFAIANGNEVFVTSSSSEKINNAIKLGAKGGVIYTSQDWHKTLLEKQGGFDVIVDSAGGKQFNYLIDLANPGGRIVLYGGTVGNIENVSPQKIFWKQLNLMGSTMGSPKDFERMIQFVNDKKIVPIIDEVFPLQNGQAALNKMEQGKQFGKLILKIT